MHLTGELLTVGDLAEEDMQSALGVPAVQLRIGDGRIVTISGLTRDEARAAAEHFGERVSINLAAVAV